MRSTELRIGNWFEYNGLFLKVDGIRPPQPLSPKEYADKWLIDCDMSTLTVPLDECKPIPLTEEWLVRFGFEKTYSELTYKEYDFNKFGVEIDSDIMTVSYNYGNDVEWVHFTHIKHVHTLQNFYHALTGEELELKP